MIVDEVWLVWECPPCEVGGTDPGPEPRCWNCRGPVVMRGRVVPPRRPSVDTVRGAYGRAM